MTHEKLVQVVVYDEEDRKLSELAALTERNRSQMIRWLINREYQAMTQTAPQVQTVEPTTTH